MNLFHLAMDVASEAHAGQVDKVGAPYLDHPIRVAKRLARAGAPDNAVIAAVLHDVIEDSAISAADLLERGFPADVVDAVVAVSKVKGESNLDYYARVRRNPLALLVKRADVADNSDERRLAKLDPEVRERLEAKYAIARRELA